MQIRLRMFLVHCYRGEKMGAYSEAYLGDVVENQGKLFDFVEKGRETFFDLTTFKDFFSFS